MVLREAMSRVLGIFPTPNTVFGTLPWLCTSDGTLHAALSLTEVQKRSISLFKCCKKMWRGFQPYLAFERPPRPTRHLWPPPPPSLPIMGSPPPPTQVVVAKGLVAKQEVPTDTRHGIQQNLIWEVAQGSHLNGEIVFNLIYPLFFFP